MNSDLLFLALIAVIACNQFIVRTAHWHTRMWLFWIVQLSNVILGSWVILWGIPEFSGDLSVINILVGALFFYHTIQNYIRLQQHRREPEE